MEKDYNNKYDEQYKKVIQEEAKRIMKTYRAHDSFKKYYHKGGDKCYIYCKDGYYDKFNKEERDKEYSICKKLLEKIKNENI